MQQPDRIIKNKISKQDFEQIAYNWLAKGDYTPDDIIENITSQNNLFMMPLYFSRGEYYGNCSASLGYLREEDYYTWDDFNRRQIRHTRTVTDWHPYSQAVGGTVSAVCYAGGLEISDEIVNFIENTGWESEELHYIPDDSPYYDGMCDLFEVQRNDSWLNRGSTIAYNGALKQTIEKLPSPIYMNLSLDIKFNENLFLSILAPFWLFTYEYLGKQYHLLVDGNNPLRVNGSKPEDSKRKKEVGKIVISGFFVGIAAILLALYYFSGEDFKGIKLDWKTLGIIFIGFIFTVALMNFEVKKIKEKSKKNRQAKLTKKLRQLEG